MKKRSDKNSATSAVAGFVGAINDRIPLPAGVELGSEAELIIWHQFTRARARSDWRGSYCRASYDGHNVLHISGRLKLVYDATARGHDIPSHCTYCDCEGGL